MDAPLADGVGREHRLGCEPVVVIGAGPAGLTAAYKLAQGGVTTTVLEADSVVGGISRTVERDGWRFDIGGHRFFTKVSAVEALWQEILGDDLLERERLSRILYRGRMFDYPLRAFNALHGLGVIEATRCVLSYMHARLRPPRDQESFEGWVISRFGRRLYEIFFKTYTEKVWGMPARSIRADWAAQRIRNLNLTRAITNAVLPRRGSTDVVSLIERFAYPRLGPGMMWERARDLCEDMGVAVHLSAPVLRVLRTRRGVTAVVARHESGAEHVHAAAHIVSSMPLRELVESLDPPPPQEVLAAAATLRYRDFLTVAVVVPESASFRDNWIYIHDRNVQVGRIQNFRSWSPDMVKPGWTCLGLEYFVTDGDDVWMASDDALVRMAARELEVLGLARASQVAGGYVVRMAKAYPVYDDGYASAVATVRDWLGSHAPNLHCVGRNGMHRYNNQDHSMLTAMLTVENILGAEHDVWSVNVDEDYHEEVSAPAAVEVVGHRVDEVQVA